MSAEITTEFLFSKVNEEKNKGELIPLPPEFYSSVQKLLDKLAAGPNSQSSEKQVECTRKLLSSLKEKRLQKLLIYLAYNKNLPQPMPNEEEALYTEIRQIIKSGESKTKIFKIKILSDIPEVITAKNRRIGPYKTGEIVEFTDGTDVDFIIKNKIGEQLE